MDNSNSEDSSKDGDIDPPPITLPEPDPFDTRNLDEGITSFAKKVRHPTDKYKDHRREKKGMGCCGGIGCFAVVMAILIAGGIGFAGWFLFRDFNEGYVTVELEGAGEVQSTAPSKATLFVAPRGKIIYNAPQTTVPIAFAAREVDVTGEFMDRLSIRGVKVICREGAHCHGDLDVYAFEYIDEGIQVDGTTRGKTWR